MGLMIGTTQIVTFPSLQGNKEPSLDRLDAFRHCRVKGLFHVLSTAFSGWRSILP
ncbi:uncharacterized protein BDW43DRAFT_278414 [Aspergillus alliaceus]|uniref:uncharacterized protein n=1 Tax=Petromyces alliaceus TaxID=209559 RepID=UPI0012A60FF1|nr:uncharacterized protein BDW43DRAFT_278414 [Aspergillus alliaceus]KAB8232726.1 hypothetical protein BDW43DRAFT_278414 [Aspergillus alliaceus]